MRSTGASGVFLNKFFDVALAEARDLPEADTGEARLLSRDVVVHPGFADAQPCGHICDCEKAFWFAESIPIWLGGASRRTVCDMDEIRTVRRRWL
jgi:hypothetical protein